MGLILDIVIICILSLSIFFGYKKGLINVIFNLCAFLVALIITLILFRPISNIVINNTEFDDNIKMLVLDKGITDKKEITSEDSDVDKYVEKYAYNAVTDAKNQAVESMAQSIAISAVNIVVSIGIFFVVRLLLILTKSLFGAIAELPVIKQFNKAGGLIYGILTGLIIIYVTLAIMFFISSINSASGITNAMEKSFIAKYLYGNNVILNILF